MLRRLLISARSVLLPLLFAILVDIIIENARRGVVNKLLYVVDFVLMTETMQGLKKRFLNWKNALKSKGLKINTRKTKVMVSVSEEETLKCKIYLCGICRRRVMANSVLCINVKTGFMANVQKYGELPSSLSYGRAAMIHVRHNKKMGTESLSFYHPNLLCCLDQMLAVMKSSQHLVSSSKTVRPIIPQGA